MEIHRADRRYRNLVAAVLAGCLLAGAAGLAWLHSWLAGLGPGAWMFGEERLGLTLFVGALSAMLVLSCVVGAVALSRLAGRIRQEQRYPPTDMRTARDVEVLRGEKAQAMAARLRIAAAMLILLALLLGGWGAWMLYALG